MRYLVERFAEVNDGEVLKSSCICFRLRQIKSRKLTRQWAVGGLHVTTVESLWNL